MTGNQTVQALACGLRATENELESPNGISQVGQSDVRGGGFSRPQAEIVSLTHGVIHRGDSHAVPSDGRSRAH
jgi:hypothetical protein